MKTLYAAIGALALATSAASAEPADQYAMRSHASQSTATVHVPSAREAKAAYAQDRAYLGRRTIAHDRATNHGSGASRSNDANDG